MSHTVYVYIFCVISGPSSRQVTDHQSEATDVHHPGVFNHDLRVGGLGVERKGKSHSERGDQAF